MTQLLTSLKQNGGRKGVRVTTDGNSFSCHNLHCWMMSQQWLVHTFSFWWLKASSPNSFMLKTSVNVLEQMGDFIAFNGLFYGTVWNWDQFIHIWQPCGKNLGNAFRSRCNQRPNCRCKQPGRGAFQLLRRSGRKGLLSSLAPGTYFSCRGTASSSLEHPDFQ